MSIAQAQVPPPILHDAQSPSALESYRRPPCGILCPGEQVRFTGRGTRRSAIARSQLDLGATYTVISSEFYLEAVRVRVAERPGWTFHRAMFDVVA